MARPRRTPIPLSQISGWNPRDSQTAREGDLVSSAWNPSHRHEKDSISMVQLRRPFPELQHLCNACAQILFWLVPALNPPINPLFRSIERSIGAIKRAFGRSNGCSIPIGARSSDQTLIRADQVFAGSDGTFISSFQAMNRSIKRSTGRSRLQPCILPLAPATATFATLHLCHLASALFPIRRCRTSLSRHGVSLVS